MKKVYPTDYQGIYSVTKGWLSVHLTHYREDGKPKSIFIEAAHLEGVIKLLQEVSAELSEEMDDEEKEDEEGDE